MKGLRVTFRHLMLVSALLVAWLPCLVVGFATSGGAACRSLQGRAVGRAAHPKGSRGVLGQQRRHGFTALAKKASDEDEDLAAEFARRLRDEDDDKPLRKKRIEDPSEQAQRNRFFSVPGTKAYSKESGEDYWIDDRNKRGSANTEKKVAPAKPAAPKNQFPANKIRAEIVSPYKNNWILLIIITVFSLAFFGFLFPEELSQIPSIRIPDFESAPTPFNIRQ